MVRGIPWDDLHLSNDDYEKQNIEKGDSNDSNVIVEVERNWEKDIISIGRRTAFGVVVYIFY